MWFEMVFKLNKNEELINENINVYEQNGIINTIIIRNVKDKNIYSRVDVKREKGSSRGRVHISFELLDKFNDPYNKNTNKIMFMIME